MNLNFRQGIIRSKTDSFGVPAFIEYNQRTGTVNLTDDPHLLAVCAHKSSNYLVEEKKGISHAWGPFVWDRDSNAPENPTYYLFWDINLSTGEITRGYTSFNPIASTVKPLKPLKKSLWFDLSNNEMNIFDGTFWVPCVKVFAGTVSNGIVSPYGIGTQVGINSQLDEFNSGYILYGSDKKAIKLSSGELLTSDTDIMSNQGGSFSSPFNIESLSTNVVAIEPIPEAYCVTITELGKAGLADSTNKSKRSIGISENSSMPGENVNIFSNGVFFNDQWNWDLSLGKDLHYNESGMLIQKASGSPGHKVASILTSNSILVDLEEINDIKSIVGPTGPTGPIGLTGPTGPSGSSGQSQNNVIVNSDEPLNKCTPVTYSNGKFKKASSFSGDFCFGLIKETFSPPNTGRIIDQNYMVATVEEWQKVTGTLGLEIGKTYFLSSIPGELTTNPDLSSGCLASIGFAISNTELRLIIVMPILL